MIYKSRQVMLNLCTDRLHATASNDAPERKAGARNKYFLYFIHKKNLLYKYMKHMKLTMRILTVCLSIALGMGSCTQNLDGNDRSIDMDWSIDQDSENPVIENSVGDIKFKFCLLNKDSVPATAFKQGENIYFYFDIMNVSEELITVNDLDILKEQDVFMVYLEETNVQVGKPWTGRYCTFMLYDHIHKIGVNNSITTFLPWSWDYEKYLFLTILFCGGKQEFLPLGEYTCRFKTDFTYEKNGKEKKLKGLSFKINFKIIES